MKPIRITFFSFIICVLAFLAVAIDIFGKAPEWVWVLFTALVTILPLINLVLSIRRVRKKMQAELAVYICIDIFFLLPLAGAFYSIITTHL